MQICPACGAEHPLHGSRGKRCHRCLDAAARQRALNKAARPLPPPLVWVYSLWNAGHECLYVGRTDSWARRRRQHASRGRFDQTNGSMAYREHAYVVLRMAIDEEIRAMMDFEPKYGSSLRR